MKKKKSLALIIAAILGIVYGAYLIVYFGNLVTGSSSDVDAIGGAIATALVTPHMVLVTLAVIFNVLAVFNCKRGFALTAGILYSVAAVVFILYGMFLIPMIILSFVGFVKLKSINEYKNTIIKQEAI